MGKSNNNISWPMFLAAHRAPASRRRLRQTEDRVLIFAPDPLVLRWIDHELFGERVTTQVVESLAEVVTTLTLVPPPWPQFLIIDVAAISSCDTDMLRAIREAGWPGVVIAIGDASRDQLLSLGVDLVLGRSLDREVL